MRDYFSAKVLLLVGCLGYAGGQFLFSVATTEPMILLARCFSGIFTGSIAVSALVYVTEHAKGEGAGRDLAKLAIIQSLGGAFGYLIGGVLGSVSIPLTFGLQVATLALCGVLYFCLLRDTHEESETREPMRIRVLAKEANPLHAFKSCRLFMTKSFGILFVTVLFANLGTYAFDQCFNYYIRDQFQLTSAYNGLIKAATGVITLVANGTICMWLIRKERIKGPTALALLCCAVSIACMLGAQRLGIFITICIVFFAFNAVYIPLLQDCVARETKQHSNLVMGFYNAVRSMGMIGGALTAGMIYSYDAKLPFLFACICFVSAAIMLGMAALKKRV